MSNLFYFLFWSCADKFFITIRDSNLKSCKEKLKNRGSESKFLYLSKKKSRIEFNHKNYIPVVPYSGQQITMEDSFYSLKPVVKKEVENHD